MILGGKNRPGAGNTHILSLVLPIDYRSVLFSFMYDTAFPSEEATVTKLIHVA